MPTNMGMDQLGPEVDASGLEFDLKKIEKNFYHVLEVAGSSPAMDKMVEDWIQDATITSIGLWIVEEALALADIEDEIELILKDLDGIMDEPE